jgi:hypothetical protein
LAAKELTTKRVIAAIFLIFIPNAIKPAASDDDKFFLEKCINSPY